MENRKLHQHLQQLAGVALALTWCFVGARPAEAVPTLKDGWHFFCAPEKVTNKVVAAARSKTGSGGTRGAVAMLNYACILELHEVNVVQQRLQKWQEAGGKGPQPKLDSRSSQAALKSAADALAAAYRSSPNDPNVLFYHGLALAVRGDVLAVNVFDALQTKHANNKLTSNSYMVLGDHYFERRDIPKAYREYANSLKKGSAAAKAYTRYKMTWIDFGLAIDAKDKAKQQKAISTFVGLKKQVAKSRGREARLAKMIDEDIANILASQGDIAEAKRVMQQLDAPDIYASILERMAFAKLQRNDVDGAYNMFALSRQEAPSRLEAFQISVNMLSLAGQKSDVKRVSDNLRYMVGNYVKGKSPWLEAQKKDTALLAKTAQQVEELLAEYAGSIDQMGRQGNGNSAYLATAKQLYDIFLKTFKKSKLTKDVQLSYAQILYLEKRYIPAANLFHDVLKANPRDKAAKDIAALMVTAAQFAFDADKTKHPTVDPGAPKGENPDKERPLPSSRKTYAESLDMFMKINPADPNVPAMLFAAGSIYFDFGHFDQGVKMLDTFVQKYPTNENARFAAIKLLTYFEKQKDKRGLEEMVAKLSSAPMKADSELQQMIGRAAKLAEKMPEKKYDESEAEDAPESGGKTKGKKDTKLVKGGDEVEGAGEEQGDDEDEEQPKKKKKKGGAKKKKGKKDDHGGEDDGDTDF